MLRVHSQFSIMCETVEYSRYLDKYFHSGHLALVEVGKDVVYHVLLFHLFSQWKSKIKYILNLNFTHGIKFIYLFLFLCLHLINKTSKYLDGILYDY